MCSAFSVFLSKYAHAESVANIPSVRMSSDVTHATDLIGFSAFLLEVFCLLHFSVYIFRWYDLSMSWTDTLEQSKFLCYTKPQKEMEENSKVTSNTDTHLEALWKKIYFCGFECKNRNIHYDKILFLLYIASDRATAYRWLGQFPICRITPKKPPVKLCHSYSQQHSVTQRGHIQKKKKKHFTLRLQWTRHSAKNRRFPCELHKAWVKHLLSIEAQTMRAHLNSI